MLIIDALDEVARIGEEKINEIIVKARASSASTVIFPFYPDCMTTHIGDADIESRPIRIFGGTLDDYNPISICKGYVERRLR